METELFRRAQLVRRERYGRPELPKILQSLRSQMELQLESNGVMGRDRSNPDLVRKVFGETLTSENGDLPFRLFSEDENIDKSEYITLEIVDLNEALQIAKEGTGLIISTQDYVVPRKPTFSEVSEYIAIFREIEKQFPIQNVEDPELSSEDIL